MIRDGCREGPIWGIRNGRLEHAGKGGSMGPFVRHAEAAGFCELLLGFWLNDSFLVICQGLVRW